MGALPSVPPLPEVQAVLVHETHVEIEVLDSEPRNPHSILLAFWQLTVRKRWAVPT